MSSGASWRTGAEPLPSAGAHSAASGGFSRGVAPGDPGVSPPGRACIHWGDGLPSWFQDPGSGALWGTRAGKSVSLEGLLTAVASHYPVSR